MSDPLSPEDLALKFRLSEEERMSATWASIKIKVQARLQVMRERNDQPMTESETATLRGHIACLKGFLTLEKNRPPDDGQDDRRPINLARRNTE